MILSTKLLRPLTDLSKTGAPQPCSQCEAQAQYYDHVDGAVYCGEHTLLEDLDPENAANQRTLQGCAVSRLAAFPELQLFSELFEKREPNKNRGDKGVWISVPTSANIKQNSADAKGPLIEWIKENLIYGAASLDPHYYIQLSRKGEMAFVYIKYQQILGSRFIGIVSWESVVDFFGERKSEA